ncbi:hypothetical protein GCM10011404_19320 [Sphingomonas prati]|nr:hypothetical protein GCM10011404_19320 [Sphingomonas prati]
MLRSLIAATHTKTGQESPAPSSDPLTILQDGKGNEPLAPPQNFVRAVTPKVRGSAR